MTLSEFDTQTGARRRSELYNTALTLSAVFIGLAVISSLLCGTVPAFGKTLQLPIDASSFNYRFLSISRLFSDAFSASVPDLLIMLALFLSVFSLAYDTVACFLCAMKGLAVGAVAFYLLSSNALNNEAIIHICAIVLCSAIIIFLASAGKEINRIAFRAAHMSNRKELFTAIFSAVCLFAICCGAVCTINIIKLLIYT
ncbi:MAG: hypothetical protein IJN63_04925 [Clostridia bacterium]|nr:hypothetical protein [Clostridia bacterium]